MNVKTPATDPKVVDFLDENFEAHYHLERLIGTVYRLSIGRGRVLAFSSIGTPNEIGVLVDERPTPNMAVTIHNFDYDGYLTWKKLSKIISLFAPNILTKHNDRARQEQTASRQ
jgi:hypothetical protein